MGLSIQTEPAESPVSLDEARDWVGTDEPKDDSRLQLALDSAVGMVEDLTGRVLVTTTFDLTVEGLPPGKCPIVLERPPAISITKIDYVDTLGMTQTLVSSKYTFDASNEPAKVVPAYNETWPGVRIGPAAVLVRYVAGYGLAAAVPKRLKTAILMITADLFEHPEAQLELRVTENKSLMRVLAPFEIHRFA